MLEDYWLPRREGGRGTEVTTLPGGQTLGQMDDVLYFQKKLYGTLNVPINRLNSDALFSLGRATEVTRDELKFARFVIRLRNKFAILFTRMLEKQLVLKQIMSIEDWDNIQQDIKFDFAKDNYFTELKDAEVMQNRVNLARNLMQDQVGRYYSNAWVRKNVLQQSDAEMEELDMEIQNEQGIEQYMTADQKAALQQQQAAAAAAPPPAPEAAPPPQAGSQIQPLANDQDTDQTPATDDKASRLFQALADVQHFQKMKNRSMQDEARYKSATQIVAKNK
jgi:hypothetical protein